MSQTTEQSTEQASVVEAPEHEPPKSRAGYDENGKVALFPADSTTQPQGGSSTMPNNEATPTAPAPRASPFRNHSNFVAGQIQIGETTYQYGQLTDALREWMDARPQAIADKLGISLGAFERDNYAPNTPENRAALAKLPEAERPELAKPDEIKKLPVYFEETYNRVLEKCLTGCDYPGVDFERTPEMITELAMEVKSALVQQISRSSKFGLSQNNFLSPRANEVKEV